MNFQSVSYKYILRWKEEAISIPKKTFKENTVLDMDGDQEHCSQRNSSTIVFHKLVFIVIWKCTFISVESSPYLQKNYKHSNFATP